MKFYIYAVYDKRATEYSPMQTYPTHGVAERAFADAVNDNGSNLNRHPEDYNLQHLGEYESETGEITPLKEGPHIIADATQLLKPRANLTERN